MNSSFSSAITVTASGKENVQPLYGFVYDIPKDSGMTS